MEVWQSQAGSSGGAYHQQVVEQEDLPLVKTQLLQLVGVWHFKEPAVAHQPAVRQGQHLGGSTTSSSTLSIRKSSLHDLSPSLELCFSEGREVK